MSHFTVLVCLPKETDPAKLDDALAKVMAPFDEGLDVTPYRSYEEGSADAFWLTSQLREKGLLPAEGDVTWAQVAGAHNEHYGYGKEVALVGDGTQPELDTSTLFVDEENGRAYTWSTYNPDSKWDYWRVGGRWGRIIIANPDVDRSALIFGDRGWDSPESKPSRHATGGLYCDGGPRGLLNFQAVQDDAAVEANERYDRWEKVCADTPPARSWPEMVSLVDVGELTIDAARSLYRDQPRIVAAKKAELDMWDGCPVESFKPDREEYVAQARRAAVPGYALVTLDGQWTAPGRMGWFGMSSDEPEERDAFKFARNTYLDQLDAETLVVLLDCHI